MAVEQFPELLNLFKVLGNESRLKIIGLLANQERSVGELAELLDLKEPTVSHHLSLMKELDLVGVRAEGNARIYRLNTHALESMSKEMFTRSNLATLVDRTADVSWEQKVLRNYLDGERVKAIPAQYKKQRVLLHWMVEKFEKGVQYPESEVNKIIQHHHPDSAWFRRSLIDQRLMARERGIYWRLVEE